MSREEWGRIPDYDCNKCGKKATHFWRKCSLFHNQNLSYCLECLLERIQEEVHGL